MLRLRLAYLALASGVLLTLSGCYSTCDEGFTFPRLFRSNRPVITEGGDCPCMHGAGSPQAFDVPPGQGPFMGPPPAPMQGTIPIMNPPPPNMPPITTRSPLAAPAPYNP